MKINSLIISNFKGFSRLNVTFKGNNATIFGDNGTGKTTIYDAFLWLLFGKDSQSNAKFSVKPISAPEGIEVAVTGSFEIAGKEVILKKTLKENWTKKRGSMEATYSGDMTDCYVNEVPFKVTAYSEYIKSICDEEVFKLLTNPLHFNSNIKWQDRRKILFEICGSVSDAELFADLLNEYVNVEKEIKTILSELQTNSTNDSVFNVLREKQEKIQTLKGYKDLIEAIGDHTFEDFKKILSDRRKAINKEIELIPTRIDEAALSIVEIDIKAVTSKLNELQPKQQELETELNKLQTGSNLTAIAAALSDLNTSLQTLERNNQKHKNEQEDTQYKAKNEERKSISEKYNSVNSELAQSNSLLQNTFSQLDTQKLLKDKYKNQYISLSNEVGTFEKVCPTCSQQIPQEQIEASKKAYEDNRNAKLTELKNCGIEAKHNAEDFNKESLRLTAKITALTTQSKLIKEQLDRIDSKQIVYTDLPKYNSEKSALLAQIQAKESELINARESLSQETERLKTALQSVRSDVENYTRDKLQSEQNTLAEKRITEYTNQQKIYIKQFEETEKQLYFCDLFTKRKVDVITKQVNQKFKKANFKLFNQLLNGGIEDCCEVVVSGVPFSDLNNAMRINVGLDIINTLQEHFSFAPPVFVDNAESVTDIYKLNSQMIKLVVSESDITLRVETDSD